MGLMRERRHAPCWLTRRLNAPTPHCDIPSVSRTVGQASGIIATAAALSWAVQTTHDLIQLLDYARGPANDGASAKVGKRSNNHCASPPQQELSFSLPHHLTVFRWCSCMACAPGARASPLTPRSES
jgi:hypothetical protein